MRRPSQQWLRMALLPPLVIIQHLPTGKSEIHSRDGCCQKMHRGQNGLVFCLFGGDCDKCLRDSLRGLPDSSNYSKTLETCTQDYEKTTLKRPRDLQRVSQLSTLTEFYLSLNVIICIKKNQTPGMCTCNVVVLLET